MVNVVCVNWGTKYSREYTQRLYNMVKRNTTKDFKFYVLTDQTSLYYGDIIPIELDGGFTGWWNKLQMFKPGILPKGEYLYFDLDVVIVDNIDCFFEHPSFGIIRDFIRPDNGILPGKEYNSSAMRFNTDLSSIWEYYIQNNIKFHDMQKQVSFFGDQNVVSSYVNYYPNILVFLMSGCGPIKKESKEENMPVTGVKCSGDLSPKVVKCAYSMEIQILQK